MIHLLAILAMATQGLSVAVMSRAVAGESDLSRYVCVLPSQEATSSEKLLAGDLADLLSEKERQKQNAGQDCPLCVLAHGAPLPEKQGVNVPRAFIEAAAAQRYEPQFVQFRRGPPLGTRAPPVSLIA